MAHVVTENCIECKYTDCVQVCPVDCFHEGPNRPVIDPGERLDRTRCVSDCPAEAILAKVDVPASEARFRALNAELARRWDGVPEKLPRLLR